MTQPSDRAGRYAVPLIRSMACRACSAGGRAGKEETEAGAVAGTGE
ncbi:hypothetical protein SMCF_5208, partial [Streptomyces coelicoflavus ZG0656]